MAGSERPCIAIFLPAFLLVIGPLPFWDELRRNRRCVGSMPPWSGSCLRHSTTRYGLPASFHRDNFTDKFNLVTDMTKNSIKVLSI
jgi:hypothetical protein